MSFGPSIGLNAREKSRFNFADLVDAAAHQRAQDLGFVLECSDEVAKRIGRRPETFNSYFLPRDFLERDLTAASASGGGVLVGTSNDLDFAAAHRAVSLIPNLPLRRLPGLVGNLTIPRAATNVATQWLANEGTAATEGDPTFSQISLTPHTLSANVDISRHTMLGLGAAANAYLTGEFASAVGREGDRAFLVGSGTAGEPMGILRVPGVANQSGTSLAWAGVTSMLQTVETYGTQDGVRWVLAPDVAKLLRNRERAAGSGFVLDNDMIAARRALVCNSVPAGAMVVAPWDRVVLGEWSALEITVTPFAGTANFQRGIISVRLMWTLDTAVHQPTALSKSESIT